MDSALEKADKVLSKINNSQQSMLRGVVSRGVSHSPEGWPAQPPQQTRVSPGLAATSSAQVQPHLGVSTEPTALEPISLALKAPPKSTTLLVDDNIVASEVSHTAAQLMASKPWKSFLSVNHHTQVSSDLRSNWLSWTFKCQCVTVLKPHDGSDY